MTDLADEFKTYLNAQHASGIPPEETRLLLNVWETLMDVRGRSLETKPPPRFRTYLPHPPAQGVPYGRVLHKLLSVCTDHPLSIAQIMERYAVHWPVQLSRAQADTYLSRLVGHGFLARPYFGQYCLTDQGRAHLAELERCA